MICWGSEGRGNAYNKPIPQKGVVFIADPPARTQCPQRRWKMIFKNYPMFIAALFIIARTWKQPRCPSADEWIRKLWYIYTMEYSAKSLQSCPTLCDPIHRQQPTRLPHPWDSPGKNTGVGCHFLLQCMKVKSKREVAQSCSTLSDPMDCSLLGSSTHEIFQASTGVGCHCLLRVQSLSLSNSVRPHRWQPTRLPRPWDSPGNNSGVGCHFLLQCMKVKSESEVAQSSPTLSDPVDCSPPGSSIHRIFQARVLEWGAIAFSEGYAKTQ